MKRFRTIFASCLTLAVLPQLWSAPAAAQTRWSGEAYGPGWPQSGVQAGTIPPNYGYPARPDGYSNSGYRPGRYGDYRSGGRYPHQPFDDFNVGIILSPDWIGGWGPTTNSAAGGYYAPGGEFSDQPVLNQPPFYSGQPAPNFYQAPTPAAGQSQYLTPRSGRSHPPSLNPAETEGSRPAATATEAQPNARRRSILVRPESDPTLSLTLAAGTQAESDYELSRTAFADGDYPAALAAAISSSTADPTNGKLLLYLAQCHFAVGEFEQSARALNNAFQHLPPEQWGLVIENFRQFYKRNDYVKQFEALLSFAEQREHQQLGAALQAYHYHYLGHPDAAAEQLQLALQASAPPPLASALKTLIPTNSTAGAATLPAPLADN